MKQCQCGSYAINVARDMGLSEPVCDVCIFAEALLDYVDNNLPADRAEKVSAIYQEALHRRNTFRGNGNEQK